MTPNQFVELAASLTVQVVPVVLLTHGLGRCVADERTRSRLWTACYALLLALTAAALAFPHPRPFPAWNVLDPRTTAGVLHLERRFGHALFFVWATGASFALARLAVRSLRVRRFLSRCRPLDPQRAPLRELLATDAADLEGVTFLTSAALSSPICWQFQRPCIVLPEHLLDCGPSALRPIVRHEREHLRSGHPLQVFLQRVVECAYWFHPLVRWAGRRSSLTREFACDEAAVASRAEIAAYLRTLLAVVERGTEGAPDACSELSFGREPSQIARRAERLVRLAQGIAPVPRRITSARSAIVGLALASLAIAGLRLPIDALASPRSTWSPWPRWTAAMLHDCGIPARDYEVYDPRLEVENLRELLSNDADPAQE